MSRSFPLASLAIAALLAPVPVLGQRVAEMASVPDVRGAGSGSTEASRVAEDELPRGDYVCHLVALVEEDVRPVVRILPDGWYAYLPGGEVPDEYEVDPRTGRVEWDGILDHDRVSATVEREGGEPMIRLAVDAGTPEEVERVCARDVGATR